MGLRVFLALPVVDGEVVVRLRNVLDELRALRGVRPVPPHQLHFTLKFFESMEEGRLPGARGAAARAASRMAPFRLRLEGVGAFPPRGPARVVWAGCDEGRDALVTLAAFFEEEFAAGGFPRSDRPFSAHLTLARVRSEQAGRDLVRHTAALQARSFGVIEVHEVVLYQSVLGPDGAAHTPLGRFRLESGARS